MVKKKTIAWNKLMYIFIGVILVVILVVLIISSPPDDTVYHSEGKLFWIRSAQGMYQSKYNTYGTFGDLYYATFLQESTFDVGNGSAYKLGYTYTLTVTSSAQWDCVQVPDDSNAPWFKIDQPGAVYWSKDKGKTWTPAKVISRY